MNMAAHDKKWDRILELVEDFGKEKIEDAGILQIKAKIELTDDGVRKAT